MHVPIDYHVWNWDTIKDSLHDKAGQRNARMKDCFVDDAEWLLREFIDQKFVSFCNRFRSCVAETAGHWHWEQSV